MAVDALAPGDFRHEAVEASVSLLTSHRISPENAGRGGEHLSLCLPRAGPVQRDWSALLAGIAMPLGFALLVMSAIVLERAEGTGDVNHPDHPALQITGFILGGSGISLVILSLILLVAVRPWWARRVLLGAAGAVGGGERSFSRDGRSIPGPAFVEVEDAATHHRFKFRPEDIAVVVFEPDKHRIRLEGKRCRYLIHGEDVFELSPVMNGTAPSVRLGYMAGDAPLIIVFGITGFWSELRRQLGLGTRQRLYDQAADALGYDLALTEDQ